MSVNLTVGLYYIYLLSNTRSLCGKQRSKQLPFLCSPKHYWRISHSSLQRGFHTSKIRCKWTKSEAHSCSKHCYSPSNHGLHFGILKLSTSAPKGLTKASLRMSRIKNTLNSVSKAVFGKQNEMISRLAQLKPSSRILRKLSDSGWLKQKNVKQTIKFLKKYSNKLAEKGSFAAKESHVMEKEDIGKQSLFHYTNNLTTKFGGSFYFISSHINSYFKREEKMSEQKENKHFQDKSELELKKTEDEKPSSPDPGVLTDKKLGSEASLDSEDDAASPSGTPEVLPISTKQSIANFLSRPTEGVQALVGGYIGGLVPKLKYDSKSQLEEQEEAMKAEQAISKDKNAEEKRRLSLQREKIIARVSTDNRTRALVQALRRTTDPRLCINRVEELTFHLLEFPEGKGVAVKEKIIPYLLRLRQVKDETLQAAVREILALIGYVDPVKGRGIRILTIDGGGTRGVVALQTLRKLVELTQKPVHQLFDYICGVSTGAILAFMLGLFHMPLDECEELYRKLGSDVFSQNVIVGTVKMSWSHAFYDSQTWENILKDRMGSSLMIETARNPMCPKVAAVSTLVNRGITPKAFVFRNYGHFPGVNSHYLGGCQYKMWQAIRASSAAPGYFAEYVLGNDLHQDGGLLLNNPSALAIHECKCLWPDVPLECIVSLGTGRYESDVRNTATHTSLKTKLSNVINSATDTEEVHVMLDGLLPPDTYFRFNPVICENIPLDESRNEKLDQLQLEGLKYIERNEEKMKKLAKILSQEKTTLQKINDWIKLKTDMYEGLPFFSKL
ncbi:calcium-independent phospholipase A2-gamma isoform X1 [Phocoena sinus]|uniref:Calcium-independent phospholipase A2-gamma n=2 Tax=Phocoena sinus TaxID=42100 RepID=A0A8C9BQP2_PHOSS|nr:calcium-independent phospholipase A2-gamma isoform X1 [Phocoena sinus]XP_032498641.1 calcium-independent phospholipase A2-gamma isoform X1 [Phocoena sinus]XP_032498642.1 calcium-independent phospholipase A2-gamma isoform X1 [Phocoena sinus]XP_032498644.1 calcium-independent phospholipase A2-gamma isoform X1 [Phocoena sinus]